jgi:demethylmenaquinone methyltransferase / 2-methoxy-6-polyprenyl-1,4-benzoquinol methylase
MWRSTGGGGGPLRGLHNGGMPEPADLIPRRDAPLPTGDDKQVAVRAMFDTIAGRYDVVNRIMTFRMDVGWRRTACDSLGTVTGKRIADLASGTGDLCVELAGRGAKAISVDLSFGMLSHDTSKVQRFQADVARLPFSDASLDGATCGFAMRNFVDLQSVFDELGRVVKPGGRIAFLDATSPKNPVLKLGHGVYFGKVVPAIGGLLSNGDAYAYLPRSLAYMPPSIVLRDQLRRAGFVGVDLRFLSGGIAQLLTGTRV